MHRVDINRGELTVKMAFSLDSLAPWISSREMGLTIQCHVTQSFFTPRLNPVLTYGSSRNPTLFCLSFF